MESRLWLPQQLVQFSMGKLIGILKFSISPDGEINTKSYNPASAVGAPVGGQLTDVYAGHDFTGHPAQIFQIIRRIFVGAVMAHRHGERINPLKGGVHGDLTRPAPVIPQDGFQFSEQAHISLPQRRRLAAPGPSRPPWKCR